MHFHCAGSHKVYVCVLASSVFLLNILLLNINIFLLNINIIIFLSLDTNFNRLRSTQWMFQQGMYLSTYLSICLSVCLSVCQPVAAA